MSSMKVYKDVQFVVPDYGGPDCFVVVYQHDFDGWRAVFGEGDYDYTAFTAAGGVNDDASSVSVRGENCYLTAY